MRTTPNTFASVCERSQQGRCDARFPTPQGSVRAKGYLHRGKARIDFDWFCTDFDLHPDAQERLRAEHRAYRERRFTRRDYRGGVSGTVTKASLALDVLAPDAEEWFTRVVGVLTDTGNFARLTYA